MKITRYQIQTYKPSIDLRIACVADLHGRACSKVLRALCELSPDLILLPGDIMEISAEYMSKRNQNAFDFFEAASKIAPCYYVFGNHEIYYSHAKFGHSKTPSQTLLKENIDRLLDMGIHIINDSYETVVLEKKCEKIHIGGLVCGRDMDPTRNQSEPDLEFISNFCKLDGFKLLLCHYPQYYEKYIRSTNIDLTLSGHAHGGQWRIFGRGIYAPHQGLFPKYTSGIHDGRLIISRGAVNNSKPIPRFFNPTETLDIQISSKKMC